MFFTNKVLSACVDTSYALFSRLACRALGEREVRLQRFISGLSSPPFPLVGTGCYLLFDPVLQANTQFYKLIKAEVGSVHMCAGAHGTQSRQIRCPGVRVWRSWELPDMGSGDQSWVLWKRRMYFYL